MNEWIKQQLTYLILAKFYALLSISAVGSVDSDTESATVPEVLNVAKTVP